MTERVRACTACHGEQGKAGPDGYYPRLAGKPADYLYNQLRNFSQERRHYPLMRGLLATLDDAYLREIALHFSRQSAPYPAPLPVKASTEILARGKALVTQGDAQLGLPACTRCHGKSLTGVLPRTPGLLGLPRDYLNAQLGGWRTGQRRTRTPDCMAQVANRLSTSDVHAVSQWLGSQTPPAPYVPSLAGEPGPPLAKEFDCRAHAMAQMPVTAPLAEQDQVLVKRGAYLARIGNCALCHTTSSGASYAGGKPIATPFGEIYSSNLTPDVPTGLGQWTADDFWHALHNGISRDGRRLYPAFPYTSYTRVTREDSDALFTYLRTLAPVYQTSQVHALRWPYSEQWALKISSLHQLMRRCQCPLVDRPRPRYGNVANTWSMAWVIVAPVTRRATGSAARRRCCWVVRAFRDSRPMRRRCAIRRRPAYRSGAPRKLWPCCRLVLRQRVVPAA